MRKNSVILHISFFIEYKVIFPRQLIMSTFYCFYSIFFLPLVALKLAGFSHFYFELLSPKQVGGGNFIPSTWNGMTPIIVPLRTILNCPSGSSWI